MGGSWWFICHRKQYTFFFFLPDIHRQDKISQTTFL